MRRGIRLLNLRRLASVRLRSVIAVIAVAAGSSLALSVVIVDSSVSYSVNQLGEQVAGSSSLRVVGATSSRGINLAALSAVASTPGVKRVVPVVQAITVVRTTNFHNQPVVVLGITCSAAAIVGDVGCAPGGSAGTQGAAQATLPPNGVFIAPSLQRQLSGASWFETDQGIQPLKGATPLAGLDSVNRGDVVVMPLSKAQAAFDRQGTVDEIYVLPAPGVSTSLLQARLTRVVGGWDGVVNTTVPPPSVSLVVGAFTPILALLAFLASAIAVVLVYNVIALTLEERRREHAVVATVGAPPSVLVIGPLIEAGTLGAIGGLLGALGGIVLAGPIVGTLSKLTVELVGVPVTVHAPPATYVIGVVLGMVIGLLAAARPVARSLRLDIAAEISGREQRERASSGATARMALFWTLLAVAGAVLSWLADRNGSLQSWQPPAALLGFLVALVFSLLAIGAWAPVVLRGLSRSRHLRGGAGRLGVANLVREPGRTAVMAVAIGATVAVAFITGSYNRAIGQDISAQIARSPQANSVLVGTAASANGFNSDVGVPEQVLTSVAKLPGVRRVATFNDVLTGHAAGQLTLVEATNDPLLTLPVFAGTASLDAFRQGQVMVGAALARRDHLHPGSRLVLDTASGFATVVVQGVWDNGDSAGDNVTMPLALERLLFGDQLPSSVSLIPTAGSSPAQIAAEARAAHLGPYLKISTPTTQLTTAVSNASGELAPFLVLQRALLLVSFISVLSTLLLVGIQRRREFGLLGAVGMKPGELFRMVIVEALAVSVVAVVLGSALSFLALTSLLDVTPLLVGYHDSFAPDLIALFVYGPIAVVVAVVASLWPGWHASQTPILEALAYE